ncbi:MAG: phosphate ABC transporter permease PstA [Candidatus Improbicoccus pseudotrichonymphae]|uniref:Phosphate transport system permease protein PstA n=1 Tax=Candidatus Improbicoccus pseudotrichonymphae TaxID=3033792 RepID=A0AA48HXR9_9FIRM|nr:MAG: phosphate ABC transporter permease PstA [Candidatus Improbicoccus pseudotrichonymphae]
MFEKNNKNLNLGEIFLKITMCFAFFSVLFIFFSIIFYIILNGIRFVSLKFVFNIYSEYFAENKGILPMIINTLYILILSLVFVIPLGVCSAIYLTQYARDGILTKIINIAIDMLSGVPSIIYGLFGLAVFCNFFKLGTSILSGCLTMILCSLSVVIKSSSETLKSVPVTYKKAAEALGASKLKIILTVILPSSFSGIITSIILASSRIMGETSALIYTTGMGYKMPKNIFSHIFKSGRTLTLHLYQCAKQSNTPDAYNIAFGTALVILILVFILNFLLILIERNKF